MEKKANLFLVGAMKAGTTTISAMFGEHPAIYAPPIKEPHYFIDDLPKELYKPSRFFSEEGYFENDFPEPLHIAKLAALSSYERIFSLATNEKHRLDASTAYLHAPETAKMIHEYNPDARIVILTRDPLKRAFSHYKMDLGLGRTTKSFEEIMKAQIDQYKSGTLPWHSYLGMSFYEEAITRYRNYFDQVLVINFEMYLKEGETTLEKISSFLTIEPFSTFEVAQRNETKKVRFQKLFYILTKLGLKDYFSKFFGARFRQRIFGIISTNKKQSMNLSETTLRELKDIFSKESAI